MKVQGRKLWEISKPPHSSNFSARTSGRYIYVIFLNKSYNVNKLTPSDKTFLGLVLLMGLGMWDMWKIMPFGRYQQRWNL